MDDCIFCKIIAGEMPSHKLYEDDDVVVILDIYPVNPGHSLIMPKKHYRTLLETPIEELQKLTEVMKKVSPAILKAVDTDSCNFLNNNGRAAGPHVFHTHWHVIPRFPTDGLKHWPGSDEHQDFEAVAEKIRKELG